jgi:hypothetical protein
LGDEPTLARLTALAGQRRVRPGVVRRLALNRWGHWIRGYHPLGVYDGLTNTRPLARLLKLPHRGRR